MNSRQRGLFIPVLDVARSEFELYIGGTVQWDVEAAQDDDAQANDSTEFDDEF